MIARGWELANDQIEENIGKKYPKKKEDRRVEENARRENEKENREDKSIFWTASCLIKTLICSLY